ncbi:hypothetical protein SAMN05444972_107110 [Marininema halotolerans]|uniref:Uncharacterized protein n=1 Tax=Marininema halotolerans TaxID=1155944 RepID=A0A1I6SIQ5_9BACL|nr:hypothetical protein SAMN05444972_107110 [Marininema halotolerans]
MLLINRYEIVSDSSIIIGLGSIILLGLWLDPIMLSTCFLIWMSVLTIENKFSAINLKYIIVKLWIILVFIFGMGLWNRFL